MHFRLSRRMQHIAVIALIVYIALIGGATYGDSNLFLRAIQHLLLSGLVIGWMVQRPFPKTPLDTPLFLYAGWLLITTVFSHDWRVSLEQSWQYLMHILIF